MSSAGLWQHRFVELRDSPVPDDEVGPELARGRGAVVSVLDNNRVLRRSFNPYSYDDEARLMEWVRGQGYPVPVVHSVAPGEMVLERIEGPTMLEDLAKHPWRLRAHARLLADLHTRLHRIDAPEGCRDFVVAGKALLHLDLHPGNVILSPHGPVVIDWPNVARGAPEADVAATWIILAVFEPDSGLMTRLLASFFQRRFAQLFVEYAGYEPAARVLDDVAHYRAADRNMRSTERVRLDQFVARNRL